MVQQERLHSHTHSNNVKNTLVSFPTPVTQAYCPPVTHYYSNVSTTEI